MLRRVAFVLAAVGAGMQLVPYGRDHDNPPTVREASWPDAESRRIAVAACYDCHSNRTNWRWYSFVAPSSWLVQRDVDEGRDKVNFSDWDRVGDRGDLAEVVEEGSMPPRQYKLMHGEARLSDEEKAKLIAAFEQMDDGGGDDRDDNSGPGSNRGPGGGD